MSSVALLLAVTAFAGLSASRWAARLAPLSSELPAKTLIATVLAVLAAAASFGWLHAPGWLVLIAAVTAPLFVFAPLALVYLVRAGGWRVARVVVPALYWTREGRAGLSRLLAQAALQEGSPEAALALAADQDALLLTQARLLEGDYQGVLDVDAPLPAGPTADNAHLFAAARVEALVELGRVHEAERVAAELKTRYDAGKPGPLGHRAVVVSEARILASKGDVAGVRELLSQPLAGVRQETLYGIIGKAAERAGERTLAANAYSAAYEHAKGQARERAGDDLRRLGVEPPAAARKVARVPVGTYALSAVLVAAYVAQLLFDRWHASKGGVAEASSLVAAFLQAIPGVPYADAWWRYLSYGFLHANFMHIAFNVWVLLDLGRMYERRRGWGDVLGAFALGTAGGAWLTTVMQAGQPLVLVGASGGILAVAGALLAEALGGRSAADKALIRSLVQWMLLILVFSLAVPGVSLWGHAGGVAGGFVYGLVRSRVPQGDRFGTAAGYVSVLLLAGAVFSALWRMVPLLS